MADEDKDDKTEEPTAKRRTDARNDGQVAKSMDLNSAVMLFAGIIALLWFGGRLSDLSMRFMVEIYRAIPSFTGSADDFGHLSGEVLQVLFQILWPILLMLLFVGVVSNVLQVGLLWTSKPLQPKLSKVFNMKKLKRLFGAQTWIELAKNMVKMGVVAYIAYLTIRDHYDVLMRLNDIEVLAMVHLVLVIILEMVLKIAVLLLALGLLDMWYQRHKNHKEMKMTKQQVKDEMKNTMGDPKMVHARKVAMMKMHRQFMMKEVPSATVVITNPTHFAVALRYERGQDAAPIVVAKGVDHMAARIRQVAEENGVPLVENRPLARSLYAAVEVGEAIPADLFGAVAEVLAFVFSRQQEPVGAVG